MLPGTKHFPLVKRAPEPVDLDLARHFPLFKDVESGILAQLRDASSVVLLRAGQVLITQGQLTDHLYLILRGRLQVCMKNQDQPHHITLLEGECVGELSLIDGQTAAAMVMAQSEAELLEIEQAAMRSLIESCPRVALNLLNILALRIRNDNTAISESFEHQVQLEQVANVDGLTGIHNRRWLDNTLPRLIKRAKFDGSPLAMIVVDVDHFKRCNDEYGHLTGDRILSQVARILTDNIRPTDLIARYGGEEFIALLPDTTCRNAMTVAERMRQAVATALTTIAESGQSPVITVSAGVTGMNADDTMASFLARADKALYRAKSEGRNRVVGAWNP